MSSKSTDKPNDDNNVSALQNMMFEQMKRLSDPEADLDKEIKRGQALSSAGTVIINAAKVQIDATRVAILTKKNNPNGNQKQLANAK